MGRLTPLQALSDSRKNILLQCVGASETVTPDFYYGHVNSGECYMLCSDGFRHVIYPEEIKSFLAPSVNANEASMRAHIKSLIDLNKNRG